MYDGYHIISPGNGHQSMWQVASIDPVLDLYVHQVQLYVCLHDAYWESITYNWILNPIV